jgi:mRNA-degrading endonuclease YafQ of YafQ-DinJ toxin-antitoxin module
MMKVEFKDSFAKDLRSVKEKGLLNSVKDIIESVEKADSLSEIQNLKKLSGQHPLSVKLKPQTA